MCFSASASFIAGTALSAAGVATLRMTTRKAEIPLAAIPLLFGMQQISEGMIWLSFRNDSLLPDATLTFVYSLFSHVLWPIFVPFAVGLLETISWRKRALAACQVAGIAIGLYLLYVITQFPVTSRVLGQHIVYESPHFYILAVMTLYLIATCVSSVLSSRRIIQIFGALSLVTFLAAYAIHAATLVSMWCFFAAVLSFIIYCYFRRERFRAPGPGSSRSPTVGLQHAADGA
jgi:uncharacterized protein DUF6629